MCEFTSDTDGNPAIFGEPCVEKATIEADRGWKFAGERTFRFCDKHTTYTQKRFPNWTYKELKLT